MPAWRSRNRNRATWKSLTTSIQWGFGCTIGCIVLLYYYSPLGRSNSTLISAGTSIPSNWDRSHLPHLGWIKTHLPSAKLHLDARHQAQPCNTPGSTPDIRGGTQDSLPPPPNHCIVLSDLGLDGLGARTTRMIEQHLIVAASLTSSIGWCPMFSLTGWEIGNTAAYFRGIDNHNLYCHAIRSLAGQYPALLSNQWWNQLRCYQTPIEQWWSIWSNCTGVLRPRPLPPLASSPFPKCTDSCHLEQMSTPNHKTAGESYWNNARAVHAKSKSKSKSSSGRTDPSFDRTERTPFGSVGSELTRIRTSLSNAYSRSRQKWCGYDSTEGGDALHVTIHVRGGDAEAYGGMASIAKPIDTVLKMIHAVYKEFQHKEGSSTRRPYSAIHFHLHTETLALSPSRFTSTYTELGPRIVFTGVDSAVIDGTIPIHIILNAEATLVLECFRSADVLILTSSSSFGRLGAFLSKTNRVVIAKTFLDSVSKFVDHELLHLPDPPSPLTPAISTNAFLLGFLARGKSSKLSVLAWCLASLGPAERARYHGFTDLGDAETVSFVLGQHTLSSNVVGACPVQLEGKMERNPNRQRIVKIQGVLAKSLTDRQSPLTNKMDLFGQNCRGSHLEV